MHTWLHIREKNIFAVIKYDVWANHIIESDIEIEYW